MLLHQFYCPPLSKNCERISMVNIIVRSKVCGSLRAHAEVLLQCSVLYVSWHFLSYTCCLYSGSTLYIVIIVYDLLLTLIICFSNGRYQQLLFH